MERPKLRKVERIHLERDAEELMVLVDPLDLCDPVAVPADAGPILDRFDGRHTLPQIRQSLLMSGLLDVSAEALDQLAHQLSAQGWLEDQEFRRLWQNVHDTFHRAATRPPRMRGVLYEADLHALRKSLSSALPSRPRWCRGTSVVGVLTPHAPIEVAAPVLDATLSDLPHPNELDLVVILATDHGAGRLPFAVTSKHYETPLGLTLTDTPTVDALVRRVPWLVQEELRHRNARAIEIVTLLLRHIYGEQCPPIVPILCGANALRVQDFPSEMEALLGSLDAVLDERRVLWWLSAELSHTGPAYGDTVSAMQQAEARDRALLDLAAQGNIERVVSHCLRDSPRQRPSGGAALATALRVLPVGSTMEVAAYLSAPAPGKKPGLMGLAGARFRHSHPS